MVSTGLNSLDRILSKTCTDEPDLTRPLPPSLRCGTRTAARRTSPTSTPSYGTPCHRSRPLPSTPGRTPRRGRCRWRLGVRRPPTAAFTTRRPPRAGRRGEAPTGRRAKRPTRCTRGRRPSTATRTPTLPVRKSNGDLLAS